MIAKEIGLDSESYTQVWKTCSHYCKLIHPSEKSDDVVN